LYRQLQMKTWKGDCQKMSGRLDLLRTPYSGLESRIGLAQRCQTFVFCSPHFCYLVKSIPTVPTSVQSALRNQVFFDSSYILAHLFSH